MLKIDPARVLADLRGLAAIGAYKTGVHRPTMSPEHVASLHWLRGELDRIGHTTEIDGIGNVLGRAGGNGPKLLGGSHLESQAHAGWLDGPLGVVYALEAARVIAADPEMRSGGYGVDVGAWCDEEGHFGFFLGSRSAVGELSEADLDKAQSRTEGTLLRQRLAAAGLDGRPRLRVDPGRYVGYFEAHIEQGDWLEASKLKIGVVTSIVGIRQFRITFSGTQNHAGTTRMAIRRDAGVACVRLCVAIEDAFPKLAGERTVWTTGRITLDPGQHSIIPGGAEVWLQMRDTDEAVLDRLEAELRRLVSEADAKGPCGIMVERPRLTEPAAMAPKLQAAIQAAAEAHVPGLVTRMPSGAGHDAMIFSRHMPSSMLFVPSIGGISHHWSENTSDEDIVLGAQVYLDAAVRMLKG